MKRKKKKKGWAEKVVWGWLVQTCSRWRRRLIRVSDKEKLYKIGTWNLALSLISPLFFFLSNFTSVRRFIPIFQLSLLLLFSKQEKKKEKEKRKRKGVVTMMVHSTLRHLLRALAVTLLGASSCSAQSVRVLVS